jgi:hypothetical protein
MEIFVKIRVHSWSKTLLFFRYKISNPAPSRSPRKAVSILAFVNRLKSSPDDPAPIRKKPESLAK